MPSPFPGMNPYLEHPDIWPEIHSRLIVLLADYLVPLVRPRYRVAIEKRIYEALEDGSLLVGIPDVSVQTLRQETDRTSSPSSSNIALATPQTRSQTVILPMPAMRKQSYLVIRDVVSREAIAAIELLSPANKKNGRGREAYLYKRQQILASFTHLIEIDLLRSHPSLPMEGDAIANNYRILVSRSETRPRAELYGFNLQESMPQFPIPLREGDIEPMVDLNALLDNVYDRGGYDLAIDYSSDPVSPLTESDRIWVERILHEQALR